MIYQKIDGMDKPLARVIQGTIMLSRDRLEECFDLLDAVFELGGTTFDTAHGYGGGDADRVLGQWMEARGNRDRVVIVGKGCHHNIDRRRVTPYDLASDLMDSLARLRTDHIDLYLLHRDDPSLPVGPIMDALADHQRAGRMRAFGGSNWSRAAHSGGQRLRRTARPAGDARQQPQLQSGRAAPGAVARVHLDQRPGRRPGP